MDRWLIHLLHRFLVKVLSLVLNLGNHVLYARNIWYLKYFVKKVVILHSLASYWARLALKLKWRFVHPIQKACFQVLS